MWRTHTHILVTLAAWGIALAWRSRTYPLQTGSHSASLPAVQGSWAPGRLLYTSLRHSQPTSVTVSHSTSRDRTTLYRLSTFGRRPSLLLVRRSGTRYRTVSATLRSPHQQQFQTIAENEPISSLPLSTHSAVEMLHDSPLYKSIIDVDTYQHTHTQTPHDDIGRASQHRAAKTGSCLRWLTST